MATALCRVSQASDWSPAAEQLARKIAAITGPTAVAVEVNNLSSLERGDVDEIRSSLFTQLAALGMRLVSSEQASATVKVSLSEDLQNYVWVAEVHKGQGSPAVVMTAIPRPAAPVVRQQLFRVTLQKTLLWSQETPILDAVVIDSTSSHLLVLDSAQVGVYRWQNSRWLLEQALPITHARPWPRDLRGRLILRRDRLFDAYLPGMICNSTGSVPLGINCRESNDPWPMGSDSFPLNAFFTPSRNYFTGVLSPGIGKQTTIAPFYSIALLPRGTSTLGILMAVDGETHLLDGSTDRSLRKTGWGSDIAAVKDPCGGGSLILATRAGDSPRDDLTAYEISDREPVAAAQPLEFGGGLTALWTDTGTGSVTSVSHSLETGKYEVFRITTACAQ